MQLRFKADRHSAAVHPSIHLSFRCVRSYSCTHAPTEMTRARDNGTEQMGWQEWRGEAGRHSPPHSRGWRQFVPVHRSSFVPSSLSLHLKSSIIFGAIGSKMPKCASFPRYLYLCATHDPRPRRMPRMQTILHERSLFLKLPRKITGQVEYNL